MTNGLTTLEELDRRIRTLLPGEYQDSYEDVQPTPMGSAGLKYAADGTVAWDEIWGAFCDLAMAGGPPHKGALLDAGTVTDIDRDPARYDEVAAEISRGITLATDLPADPSPIPGWVRVTCYGETMAGWLLRAIAMENVAVRRDHVALDLPAAPAFRLEKEIKNVITVIAKTSHYWIGHMPRDQKPSIERLFAEMAREHVLVEPEVSGNDRPDRDHGPLVARMADAIRHQTGLVAAPPQYRGWLGLVCPSVPVAVWLMRAAVASNLLSRREATSLFVPVNATSDPAGETVIQAVGTIHRLAIARGIL